jgi:hypothetical protein
MTVTRAQIQEHSSRQSCWVAIHGAVYDVTGLSNCLGWIPHQLTEIRFLG